MYVDSFEFIFGRSDTMKDILRNILTFIPLRFWSYSVQSMIKSRKAFSILLWDSTIFPKILNFLKSEKILHVRVTTKIYIRRNIRIESDFKCHIIYNKNKCCFIQYFRLLVFGILVTLVAWFSFWFFSVLPILPCKM